MLRLFEAVCTQSCTRRSPSMESAASERKESSTSPGRGRNCSRAAQVRVPEVRAVRASSTKAGASCRDMTAVCGRAVI